MMNNSIIKNILKTDNSVSTLPLRIIAGIIFAAHGAQKLFAWFGGYGLDGTGQWMESIGLGPGYLMALTVGSVEFFGGILLILGLLTRPTSAVLAITMVVAIIKVHLANGLFMANNGYEFALALLAMSVALAIHGAGKYSVDQKISQKI